MSRSLSSFLFFLCECFFSVKDKLKVINKSVFATRSFISVIMTTGVGAHRPWPHSTNMGSFVHNLLSFQAENGFLDE